MTPIAVRGGMLVAGLLCCAACTRKPEVMQRAARAPIIFTFTTHFEGGCPKTSKPVPAGTCEPGKPEECVYISKAAKDRVKFKAETNGDPKYKIKFNSSALDTMPDPDVDPALRGDERNWELKFPSGDPPNGDYKFTVYVRDDCQHDPTIIVGQ